MMSTEFGPDSLLVYYFDTIDNIGDTMLIKEFPLMLVSDTLKMSDATSKQQEDLLVLLASKLLP